MNKNNIIVNSWNEWDPLKHVIVGRADGCCIPPPEPALDAKVPEDSDMKGKYGPRTKWWIRMEGSQTSSSTTREFSKLFVSYSKD